MGVKKGGVKKDEGQEGVEVTKGGGQKGWAQEGGGEFFTKYVDC